ncbi:PPPDE putative peptidase domain-domain-containing protein [Protomyces lactucae-debilis]|uniref:PPPDE putative peptidase domain-domain-containing protein n=1 Tax=Protomyces lactucae-debilis TaxID=2754530 RepID=A0A1Y2FRV6_PROLT|nr:PPPDE putative peptidase domain-containing protein [Protomyces lactucae-debilis]ORY85445.1 PPPDE putative peptidase domain-domain-containing protein [Protomyces lactucae-debilis]
MDVHLYIYDLSNGLARSMSVALTGTYFDAIYHTSVVLNNREYFFGGSGIESTSPPGQGHSYGTPIERRKMGQTQKSIQDWQDFLHRCAESYGVGKYHLLEHNCNTFSDYALQFLIDQRIPAEISSLPSAFLATPFGKMFRPQIDAMYAPNANAGARTEAPITGPTSSSAKEGHPVRETRVSEAFQFLNTPTLAKVFGKIKTQETGLSSDALDNAEAYVQSVISGKAKDSQASATSSLLQTYLETVPLADAFPGLDLLRLLVTNTYFATQLANSPLLGKSVTMSPSEAKAETSTCSVHLKFLANSLVQAKTRTAVGELLDAGLLERVAASLLHDSPTVRSAGLKTIWNTLLLAPTDKVSEDFRVACLASVDALSKREGEGGQGEREERELMRRIVKELMAQGGMETLQMADVLEMDI